MSHQDLPVSPLAPKVFPDIPEMAGVRFRVCEAGFKYKGRNDLLMVMLDEGTTGAGVFTQSSTAAAPVHWCKRVLKESRAPRALVVTAGNANAFTADEGTRAVQDIARLTARQLDCETDQILIAQTGVIGEIFPVHKFEKALPQCMDDDACSWLDAAKAIMTTDTFPKLVWQKITLDGKEVTIAGFAKGSGMIAPDMATMLGFILTDAAIHQDVLQAVLGEVVQKSFNAITVDGDTSTNDSVLAFATSAVEHAPIIDPADPRLVVFRDAFLQVCQDLAQQIVRDGEGASKFIEVEVVGATDDASAKKVVLSIANSPLVKTAIAGGDANWGRIVMAVGKSGEPIAETGISISFGPHLVAKNGRVSPDYKDETGTAYFKRQELNIQVDLGVGAGKARVWTCDLTHGYISINADYRS